MHHQPAPPSTRCSIAEAKEGLRQLRDRANATDHQLDQAIDTFYTGMGEWLESVRTEMASLASAFDALAPDAALDTAQSALSRVEASTRLLRHRAPRTSKPAANDEPWTPADLRSNMAALRAQLKADREQRASEAAAERASFLAALRSDVLRIRGVDARPDATTAPPPPATVPADASTPHALQPSAQPAVVDDAEEMRADEPTPSPPVDPSPHMPSDAEPHEHDIEAQPAPTAGDETLPLRDDWLADDDPVPPRELEDQAAGASDAAPDSDRATQIAPTTPAPAVRFRRTDQA